MIERVQRFGQWQRSLAENICFDDDDPKEIVFNMLVGKFRNGFCGWLCQVWGFGSCFLFSDVRALNMRVLLVLCLIYL